ncbi:hypothetical protein [Vulcanisaeta distributa]|uniref:hypothetical protein n=1 Tax=Vulcanisaeta distributa TaxID=164451 RepID=UPI000A57E76A|nr:hypothetical protein [Vulcanisaeta distributa]
MDGRYDGGGGGNALPVYVGGVGGGGWGGFGPWFGFGWFGWIIGALIAILFLIFIILVIVWIIRNLVRTSSGSNHQHEGHEHGSCHG